MKRMLVIVLDSSVIVTTLERGVTTSGPGSLVDMMPPVS